MPDEAPVTTTAACGRVRITLSRRCQVPTRRTARRLLSPSPRPRPTVVCAPHRLRGLVCAPPNYGWRTQDESQRLGVPGHELPPRPWWAWTLLFHVRPTHC